MREELQKHTAIAEKKMSEALQEFHDATGLIPTGFDFSMVDCTSFGDREKGGRRCVVGEHALHAET